MNDSKGFILWYRRIMEHPLFDDGEPFTRREAWAELVMLAKYKDENFHFKGSAIEGKRGCVYRSVSSLANRFNWSRGKTIDFLKMLESEGMIERKTSSRLTVIRIVNYEKYQGAEALKGQFDEQPIEQLTEQLTEQLGENNSLNSPLNSSLNNSMNSSLNSPLDTYNNNNKENKENNTYSDIELSISAPADPYKNDSDNSDDDEDDDGAAFYKMMIEQYGPEV
ncbi:MAG: hypothetical protein IJL91_14710, partial [Bacteroidales bacterium]|nr:hypothetical protein [Bacteroidales bacterium]